MPTMGHERKPCVRKMLGQPLAGPGRAERISATVDHQRRLGNPADAGPEIIIEQHIKACSKGGGRRPAMIQQRLAQHAQRLGPARRTLHLERKKMLQRRDAVYFQIAGKSRENGGFDSIRPPAAIDEARRGGNQHYLLHPLRLPGRKL